MNYSLKFLFKKYDLKKVFTPTSYASLTFINRPTLNNQIEKFISQVGMQIIIYGHSGSGKSTLINNILKEKNFKVITSRVVKGTAFNDLIYDAFDKLSSYYTCEISSKQTLKIKDSLKQDYKVLKSELSKETVHEEGSRKVRVLPVQLTSQRLGEFLGAADCVWVIEDFHKINEEEKINLVQTVNSALK
jgi:septin family protein